MTFGAAVWAPMYLEASRSGSSPLAAMAVQYRQGLYTLLGLTRDLRLEVLYAACLRWPLEVPVGKAVLRYYYRL